MGLKHATRQFTKGDFEIFDYILAMETNNMVDIKALETQAKNTTYKLMMVRDFDEFEKGSDVPDRIV